MKRFLLSTLTLLGTLFVTQPLQAQMDDCCPCFITEGMYIGGYGGATWWNDHFATSSDSAGSVGEFELDLGYVFGAFIGYRCGNGLRVEFDFGYRHSDYEILGVYNGSSGAAYRPADSDWDVLTLMANFIFETAYEWCEYCVNPYFGFGVGGARVEVDLDESVNGVTFGGTGSDNEWAFAFQLIVGLAYQMTDCAQIGIDYRLLGIDEFSVTPGGGLTFSTISYTFNHSVAVVVSTSIGSFF